MGKDDHTEFFIDTKPSENIPMKRHFRDSETSCNQKSKKIRHNKEHRTKQSKQKSEEAYDGGQNFKKDIQSDSGVKSSIVYYENVLKDLKKGDNNVEKDALIHNSLEESEGKEVELSCHSLVSHCLEMLLTGCKDNSIILRFMSAFAENKVTVCTSANASHITESLIYYAVKTLKDSSLVTDSEDNKDNTFVTYCINWLLEFANFILENFTDCLCSQYSCHVICTLIGALAGDLTLNNQLMSKNLKNHKKEFHSQFSEINSQKSQGQHNPVALEQIPKAFSDMLKLLYKSLLKSENIIDLINDSSSATVVQVLIFALKKRHRKACKKMITKLARIMFLKKNLDETPVCLLHKNASYVFDEMFKAADEDLQFLLWNEYISVHIEKLVIDPVGNFVIQRLFDAINSKNLFETACKQIWCVFDQIVTSQNYGILVSISTACNRLGAQQSFFMENIMQCLHCHEPIERQDLLIPLLLAFRKYDDYVAKNSQETQLKICLQGSLVVQAILKFQRPMKAVKSILSMTVEEVEFLAGHMQGCHVLNAFFGSVTVGEKNKEKLLYHLEPALVTMACDRNKSLTLSRIWTSLSLKLKEIIARKLADNQEILKSTSCGYAVYQKFGIPRFRKLQEWKQMQSSISSTKKFQKH